MRRAVAGVGVDGELKRGLGLVEGTLGRVEHRQVVVRLGELGVVLGEGREGLDRLVRLVLFREDQAPQETALGFLGLRLEVRIDLLERRLQAAGLVEALGFLEVVGRGGEGG